MRLTIAVLLSMVAVPAALADDTLSVPLRVPARPEFSTGSNILGQSGAGCAVGATTGAVLSILGTVGLTIVPATVLGCGVGAVAGPVVIDQLTEWHFQGSAVIDQTVRPAMNKALDYLSEWLNRG